MRMSLQGVFGTETREEYDGLTRAEGLEWNYSYRRQPCPHFPKNSNNDCSTL